jgi:hypothetical protein
VQGPQRKREVGVLWQNNVTDEMLAQFVEQGGTNKRLCPRFDLPMRQKVFLLLARLVVLCLDRGIQRANPHPDFSAAASRSWSYLMADKFASRSISALVSPSARASLTKSCAALFMCGAPRLG